MRALQGLIACVGVGIVVYLAYDLHAQQGKIAELHTEMTSLTHALDEARPSVVVHERTREIAAPPVTRDPDVPPAPAPEASAEAPPTAPAPPDPAETRLRFSARFNDEHRDAGWANASQATATAKLSAALPPSSELTSVECRSSMCKIETTHPDVQHYQQFARGAFMDPSTTPWNGAFFSTGSQDPTTGRFIAVAYLFREGEALPRLD